MPLISQESKDVTKEVPLGFVKSNVDGEDYTLSFFLQPHEEILHLTV